MPKRPVRRGPRPSGRNARPPIRPPAPPATGAPRDSRRSDRPGSGGDEWLYGRHAVTAALGNKARRFRRLALTREAEEALARSGIALPIAPERRSPAEIAALLPEGAAHQGYALLADPPPPAAIEDVIADLADAPDGLVVVLDQVTDPRNVGAILRSAAAFGAAAVILPERHGAEATAALAKTASGALETVALVRVVNVARTLDALKAAGFWCVALEARAPGVLADVDLSGRIALVLGSEGAGLRRLVADTCDIHARLPIGPGIESLNVSAAAAIALYEVTRRRKQP